jgi:hypothetical protein
MQQLVKRTQMARLVEMALVVYATVGAGLTEPGRARAEDECVAASARDVENFGYLPERPADQRDGRMHVGNQQGYFIEIGKAYETTAYREFARRDADDHISASATVDIESGLARVSTVPVFGGGAAGLIVRLVARAGDAELCRDEHELYIARYFESGMPPIGERNLHCEAELPASAAGQPVRVEATFRVFVDIFGTTTGSAELSGSVSEIAFGHCAHAAVAVDRDGDGSNALNDCDDLDSSRSPDKAERCDGVENDCDGRIDEAGGTATFRDRDGDGFGGSESTTACTPPAGFVTRGGDCNDADRQIRPAANEECDGRDNNCNGEVDERSSTARQFRDADGDGHGDPLNPSFACGEVAGYVASSDDCDDRDATLAICNTPVSDTPAAISCEAPSGNRATLHCGAVTEAGDTTCAGRACELDEPSDFSVRYSGECFDIRTSATCEGDPASAILCIEYDPESLDVATGPCAANPETSACMRMLYCEGSSCADLERAPGTDFETHVFCAYVASVPSAAAVMSLPLRFAAKQATVRSESREPGVFVLAVDQGDVDLDGIPAYLDNCPEDYNPSQQDSNRDGIGDKCSP